MTEEKVNVSDALAAALAEASTSSLPPGSQDKPRASTLTPSHLLKAKRRARNRMARGSRRVNRFVAKYGKEAWKKQALLKAQQQGKSLGVPSPRPLRGSSSSYKPKNKSVAELQRVAEMLCERTGAPMVDCLDMVQDTFPS